MNIPKFALPPQLQSSFIDWTMLTPDDFKYARACADRACNMATDYKRRQKRDDLIDPEPKQITIDLCVVAIRRGLSLWQLLHTSDLDFAHDYYQVMQHINRVDATFPAQVELRCAKKAT